MYIFVGINVEKTLENIGRKVNEINDNLGYEYSTLPLHISLKMSFEIDNGKVNNCIEMLTNYLKNIKPFTIYPKGIENEDVIIWLRMNNDDQIDRIHLDLVNIIEKQFGIAPHEFDLDYKFHTTLFMSDDVDKNRKAYEIIKNCDFPMEINANKIIIGTSQDGTIGTYRVYKEIQLQ